MHVKRTLVLFPLALLLFAGGLSSRQKAEIEGSRKGGLEEARVLLHRKDPASRLRGLGLARRGFLVELLPELRALRQASGFGPRQRRALELAIQELEHYARMRLPFRPLGSTSASLVPRAAKGLRPPLHRLRLLCVDRKGAPLPGARVRAYCRDYDLFLPFEGFATCDAKGCFELLVPEGRWSFIAGASPKGPPTLILIPDVSVTSSKTLLLFPEESVRWRMEDGDAFRARRLVLRHENYPQVVFDYRVQGKGGTVEGTKGGLKGWMRGTTKGGVFVVPGGRGLRFDPGELLPRRVLWGSEGLEDAEIRVRLAGKESSPEFTFPIRKSGEVLWFPAGSLDLGYGYSFPRVGRLEFGLRPFTWRGRKEIWLGTPLRPWVWHLAYFKRYRGAPPFAFQVFFQDPQKRLLDSFFPVAGLKSPYVSVRISKAGRYWLWVRRLRDFRIHLRESLLPAALDDLDYEIEAPFPIVGSIQTGHHSTRFHTRNYDLTGPALLAPEIRNFLRAAEFLFQPIRSVALRRLPWLRGRIVFHATMPKGVRAYSSPKGISNFSSRDLVRCVRLADALRRTPIIHEHLHTVGYKHADFMDVAGFRLRKSLFSRGSRGQGGELGPRGKAYTAWFLGGSERPHKKAILRTFLARFGGEAFDAFLRRRKDRASLEAKGLTEAEAKAVLFSRILGRDLFPWFGVSPQRSKGLEDLLQLKPRDVPSPARTGPGPQDLLTRMRLLLGKKGPKSPTLSIILRDLQKLPTQRVRIRTALRLGAQATQAHRLSLAYPFFREALRVAQKMSPRIFTRTRAAAVDVCMGKPLHLGWL